MKTKETNFKPNPNPKTKKKKKKKKKNQQNNFGWSCMSGKWEG